MRSKVFIILIVLAIPVYLLSRLFLKKMKLGSEKNRKYLAIIPTIVMSPILYVGMIMIWVLTISYFSTSDFNKDEWNLNTGERYKMSKNLIESKILVGKTRNEVIDLLGKDFVSNTESRLTYELGYVPELFNIDPGYLQIVFENRVVKNVNQNNN